MATAKKHYATRDFNDAGSGRNFAAGKPIENVGPGELVNYCAAGLATDQKPGTTPAA